MEAAGSVDWEDLAQDQGGETMKEQINPFAIAQKQLDRAAVTLGLDEATHTLLRWPMREYAFMVPLRLDDGSTKVFRGYRVQYNTARGPAKGGCAGIRTRVWTLCEPWRHG